MKDIKIGQCVSWIDTVKDLNFYNGECEIVKSGRVTDIIPTLDGISSMLVIEGQREWLRIERVL